MHTSPPARLALVGSPPGLDADSALEALYRDHDVAMVRVAALLTCDAGRAESGSAWTVGRWRDSSGSPTRGVGSSTKVAP